MRTPANAAEVRSMEKAYTSSDPFAIGKHERPGFKLIREVDQLLETVFASSKFGL